MRVCFYPGTLICDEETSSGVGRAVVSLVKLIAKANMGRRAKLLGGKENWKLISMCRVFCC